MSEGPLVIVAPAMRDGGSVGAVAWRHAVELSKTRKVFVVTRNVPEGDHPGIVPRIVKPRTWGALRRLAHVPNELSFLASVRKELRALARDEGVATVWCHSHATVALAAAPVRREYPFRIVMTTHGDIFDRPPGTYSWDLTAFYRAVTPRAYRQADAVHALSPYMAEWAVRGGAAPVKVHVIPSGVAPADIGASELAPRTRESFMPQGQVRLLYVGSLWHVKGVDVLIRAVAGLVRHVPAKLTIAGTGPERGALDALVAQLRLGDAVEFIGHVPRHQLHEVYAKADVLCVPSRSEALSLVTLEAMLCGVPVVGSRTGGIPLLVDEGKTGHLAEPGDVASWTLALQAVASSKDHLAQLGVAGFASARSSYTWEQAASRLAALTTGRTSHPPVRIANYLRLLRPQSQAEWSIGIYAGATPLTLSPHPDAAMQPVLTRFSLAGLRADGVADPFMVRHGDGWVMFFEIENRRSGKGEIGYATSKDALQWRFEGLALVEGFHLSYPQVFASEGQYFMVPEAASSGAVRLYKAEHFPSKWKFVANIIDSPLADPSLIRHDGRWWIVALDGFRNRDDMVLYHADRLEGPWLPHAGNPVVRASRRHARPAGRVIAFDGKLVRFAQDYSQHYGRCVRAFRIDELTSAAYRETLLTQSPMLGPSGEGWNATGMHHVDAHEITPGQWIACVDGRRNVKHWPLWDRLEVRWGAFP